MTKTTIENISFRRVQIEYQEAAIQLALQCHPQATVNQVSRTIGSMVAQNSLADLSSGHPAQVLYGAFTQKGKLIGLCVIQTVPFVRVQHFGFGGLMVDPACRKRGIGSDLARHALEDLSNALAAKQKDGTV